MIAPDMHLLAQTAAERVVNSIPEGLAIAGFAWLLLRIARRQHSGTRFVVWFAALLAVAALPFVPHSTVTSGTGSGGSTVFALPASFGVGVAVAWLLIASWAVARIAFGLWNVRRLREASVAIAEPEMVPAVREAVQAMQAMRRVEIRQSAAVTVPTAIGLFKPMILLPLWAIAELPAEELRVVLFHEFAHLRRWDDWTNLAQKLIRTILFFHPAVWWIERRLALEREMACDDLVLAETENPREYAECLVSLAEKSAARRTLALAQAVIGRAKETAQRLARILDGNRRVGTFALKPALGLTAVLAAAGIVALPYRMNLVSFESTPAAPALATTVPGAPLLSGGAVVPVVQVAGSRTPRKPVRSAAIRKSTEQLAKVAAPAAKAQMADAAPARNSESVARGMEFVVVMQTTRFDGRGVQFCVWQITVDRSDRRVVREELVMKSL